MKITVRSNGCQRKREPFKVTVCLVTLVAFLCSMVFADITWAVESSAGFPDGGLDRAGGPGLYKTALDIDTVSVPLRFGEIREASKGTNGRTIIHIQDAHCNYAAQMSIDALIRHLTGTYAGIDLVSLEGGAGEYDLSLFDGIRDEAIKKKVADYFVGEGRISGPEFFAITHAGRIKLFGIENENFYIDGLRIYRESLAFKKDADRCLGTLSAAVDNLKGKVYSPVLMEFDARAAGHAAGKIGFKAHLLYLKEQSEKNAVDISRHKNLSSLLGLLQDEKDIDFERADKERAVLLDKMSARLSPFDIDEITRKTVLFRNKDISADDFYAYLLKKAKFISVNFDTLPNLTRYSAYLARYEGIDRYAIFNEMKDVERSLMARLAETDDQKALAAIDRNITIMKHMLAISLTGDEYDYYTAHKEEFRAERLIDFIQEKAPGYGLTVTMDEGLKKLDGYRESMERFYTSAARRDGAFVENIEKKLTSEKRDVTVLVTGGFHKDNLSKLFRQRGYSYIEVMPTFENTGRECNYFKLLAGEQSGFEKSLGSVISTIQIASLCNELGVDVYGEEAADIFRIGVIALGALYGSKEKLAFALEDGRFVVFEDDNGNPVCRISGTPDGAALIPGKPVSLDARSLMHAFHEIGQDRPIAAAGSREYLHGDSPVITRVRAMLGPLEDSEAKKALLKVLDDLLARTFYSDGALKRFSPPGYSAIQIVDGLRSAHAGGQGIYLPRIYSGGDLTAEQVSDYAALLIHELIAASLAGSGELNSHALAEAVENAVRSGIPAEAGRLLANASLYTGNKSIGEMTPEERLAIGRDYASGRTGTTGEQTRGIADAEAEAFYGTGQQDPANDLIGMIRAALLRDPDIAALSDGRPTIDVRVSRDVSLINDDGRDMAFLDINRDTGTVVFSIREPFLELLMTLPSAERDALLRQLVSRQMGKDVGGPALAAFSEEAARLHNLACTTAGQIVERIGELGGMVSLDGMTGAGKSTYAGMLRKRIQWLAQCDVDVFTLDMFLYDKAVRGAINRSVLGEALTPEETAVLEELMRKGLLPGFEIGKPWSGNEYMYRNAEIREFLGKIRAYLDWQDGSEEFDVVLHNVYDQGTGKTLREKKITLAKSSAPGRKRIFIVEGLYANREDVRDVYDARVRLKINEETSKARYVARSIARSGAVSEVDQKKYDAFILPSYRDYEQRTGADIDVQVDLDAYSSVAVGAFSPGSADAKSGQGKDFAVQAGRSGVSSVKEAGAITSGLLGQMRARLAGVRRPRGPPPAGFIQTARKAFSDPQPVRDRILRQVRIRHEGTEEFSNRPSVYVFPTRFCPVGCTFCYFASPMGKQKTRENAFDDEGTEKFIAFTQDANPAGIVVSGGGDPFVELDKVVKIVSEARADKITLVTSAFWARSPDKVKEVLRRLSEAVKRNPHAPEVILRLSIDEFHKIRVPLKCHANIIKAFSEEYLGQEKFRLMVHSLRGDGAMTELEGLLQSSDYGLPVTSRGDVDEISSEIVLDNGLQVKVRRVDIFNANQEIDLNNITLPQVDANFRAFARKNTYKATRGDGRIMMGIQTNARGEDALDFLINYDGLMEVWASSMPDNRSNMYEETYGEFREKALTDVITLAELEKGIQYVKDLVYEVNPIAMDRAIAINIPDWFSRLAFEESKTRLYVSVRILQDYVKAGRVSRVEQAAWPKEVRELVSLDPDQLRQLYHESDYGIVNQYLERPDVSVEDLARLYKMIMRNHYDVTTAQAREAILSSPKLTDTQKLEFLMEAAKIEPQSPESVPVLLDALKMSGELLSDETIGDYAGTIHAESGRLLVESAITNGHSFLLHVIVTCSKTEEVLALALDAFGYLALAGNESVFGRLISYMEGNGENWAAAARIAGIFEALGREEPLSALRSALIRAGTEDPLSGKGVAFRSIARALVAIAQAGRLVVPLEEVITQGAALDRVDVVMPAQSALEQLADSGLGKATSAMYIIANGLTGSEAMKEGKDLNRTQWALLSEIADSAGLRLDANATVILGSIMRRSVGLLDDPVATAAHASAASALFAIAEHYRMVEVLADLMVQCQLPEIRKSAADLFFSADAWAGRSALDRVEGLGSDLAYEWGPFKDLPDSAIDPRDIMYVTEPEPKEALVGSPASIFDFMTMPGNIGRAVSLSELNMEARLSFDTIEKDMRLLRAAGLVERENRYGVVVFWVNKDVSRDPRKLAAAKRILDREFAPGKIVRNSSRKNRDRIAAAIGDKMLSIGPMEAAPQTERDAASRELALELISKIIMDPSESALDGIIERIASLPSSMPEKEALLVDVLEQYRPGRVDFGALLSLNRASISFFIAEIEDFVKSAGQRDEPVVVAVLGSGNGRRLFLQRQFAKLHGLNVSFAAFDNDDAYITRARKLNPDVQFVKTDLSRLKESEYVRELKRTFNISLLDVEQFLHELYSFGPGLGRIDDTAGRRVVRDALEGAMELLQPGGRIVLFDGIIPDQRNEDTVVRLSDEYMRAFELFAGRKGKPGGYVLPVPYTVLDKKDNTIRLTRGALGQFVRVVDYLIRQAGMDDATYAARVEGALSEVYQFFTIQDYQALFSDLNLRVGRVREVLEEKKKERLGKNIEILSGARTLPTEHVLIGLEKAKETPPAVIAPLVVDRTVICNAGPEMVSAGGGDSIENFIKEPMNEVGALVKSALYREMFEGEPCYVYGIGAVPTDQNGTPLAQEQIRGSMTGVESAANSFVMRERLGNVNFIFGNGTDFAKTEIRKLLGLGIQGNRIRCSISESMLEALEKDVGFLKDLGPEAQAKGLRQLLEERTRLLIVRNDVQTVEGKDVTVALPFGRIGLEGLAKLNVEHYMQREGAITVTDSSYVRVVSAWAKCIGLLTNNDRVVEAIIALATDKDKGPDFISKTFEIMLPSIVRIDVEGIADSFRAETEVLRAL